MKQISNFTILTVPCNKKLVVSKEKTKDFKNISINKKIRKQNKELYKKVTRHINK